MLPIITISIPSYLILATIGAVFSSLFLFFRSDKFNISFKSLVIYIIVGFLCSIVGSRILFVITIIPSLIKNFTIDKLVFYIFNGGLVFYGGLIGIILGMYVCSKIRKDDTLNLFNFAAPAFPLFHVFGRIGCFLAGCCYGVESTFGFSMSSSPEIIRFPVQLFEALANLLIFISLIVLPKYKKINNLMIVYLLEYGVCRFILEFFRGDTERGIWGFLSTSQIISICIIIVCMLLHKKSKGIKEIVNLCR